MKSYKVYGKVQGVMFRQTFIRGLQKRNLRGGATNNDDLEKSVSITIEAEHKACESIIDTLLKLKTINSWDATVEKVFEIPKIIPTEGHEVNTSNVDQFSWSKGVEFYF